MNNYLMMGHILQCRIIPKEQVHPELWVGANRKWRVVPRDRLAREKQNMVRFSYPFRITFPRFNVLYD